MHSHTSFVQFNSSSARVLAYMPGGSNASRWARRALDRVAEGVADFFAEARPLMSVLAETGLVSLACVSSNTFARALEPTLLLDAKMDAPGVRPAAGPGVAETLMALMDVSNPGVVLRARRVRPGVGARSGAADGKL